MKYENICYNGNPDIAHQVMGNKSKADECSHNHHAETDVLVVEQILSHLQFFRAKLRQVSELCPFEHDPKPFGEISDSLAGIVLQIEAAV